MTTFKVKSSDNELLGRHGHKCKIKIKKQDRTEEKMSVNELEGLRCEGLTLIEICVTFLCAQSRREKWERGETEIEREKERGWERGCKIEGVGRVEFL